MTNTEGSLPPKSNPFTAADAPTLAEVLTCLETDLAIDQRQRREMCSAVRSFARLMNRPLSELPAHPEFLRARLKSVVPAAEGMNSRRWANIRSLLLKALKISGVDVMPGRYQAPLTEPWLDLSSSLKTRTPKIGLSRFFHFCSAGDIDPEAVTPATFDLFRGALVEDGVLSDPRVVDRDARRCWNLARESVDGWPQVVVDIPNFRNWYTNDWSDFPSSLLADVDAMLESAQRTDPLVETNLPRIGATTADDRRVRLRRIATAAALSGIAADRLRSIADLVDVPAAKAILRFFLARSNQQPSVDCHQNAKLLWTLAKHWVGVEDDHLAELARFKKRLDPGRGGLTQKNRGVINFFDDPARVSALLNLPEAICRRHTGSVRLNQVHAVQFQVAVAVAILIVAPVRIGNLASIHLDRHLIRTGDGVRLFFAGSEVKNGVELDFPLPDWVVRLVDRYILEVRPGLSRAPNDWLFPGADADHKGASLLSAQIADFTTSELGKRITAHQFRHLAAFLYLRKNPGAHETVRRLLGHRSIQTTIDFYAALETADAVRHYDRTILALKNEPVAPEPGSRRRRRKP